MFKYLFFSNYLTLRSHVFIFNYLIQKRDRFFYLKITFIVSSFISNSIIFYSILSIFITSKIEKVNKTLAPVLRLLVGKDENDNNVYLSENSLYQNIMITGSIGSGKTSSAMYPFTKQLISYKSNSPSKKLSFLILDVKGNYYSKVLDFAKSFGRLDDVIVINLNGKYKYNPLDKPDLKSSVLANRLKTILLLFSPNNSESYWLDMAEHILESCINFCRIYNKGYVTFDEIHMIISNYNYFLSKITITRNLFISGLLNKKDCYLLLNSISFLQENYYSLDSRTHNLLQSEITRITNYFVADYEINNTFCPKRDQNNFKGFDSVIKDGKIVVLNMNIAEYKNISKIIAAYLKLDFQTDVLKQLSDSSTINRPTVFISDEYQEFITSSDADFFSQSRESKCINIVSTQSYSSLLNTLKDKDSLKVILQNFVNKLWFRTDDNYTIENIQKLIGKEEKQKISKSYSESSKEIIYDIFSHDFISIKPNLSESINSYTQKDFIYDSSFFSQKLDTFSCLSFLSDGKHIACPKKLNMLPFFK